MDPRKGTSPTDGPEPSERQGRKENPAGRGAGEWERSAGILPAPKSKAAGTQDRHQHKSGQDREAGMPQ